VKRESDKILQKFISFSKKHPFLYRNGCFLEKNYIIPPMPSITGVIDSSLSATTAKVVSSVSPYFLPIRIKISSTCSSSYAGMNTHKQKS
ncbi:hypothetical protein P9026_28390, partial [Bacillus thuringiensis]|uniref:hypothetical protein n=2 Tax=Bacillus thuringiensis TaxID=1428 RepID=UPI002DBDBF1A